MTATSTMTNPRRYLPLIIAMSGVGVVLTASLIVPALPDLASELGVSKAMIGWVQGAVAVPGIFLALFVGYLADRVGRRKVAAVSLTLYGLAGLACFFTRTFWMLVGVRAVQGLGTVGLLSLSVIVIGDIFPAGTERRWALGVHNAGLTVIGIVSPIVGGALAEIDPFLPFTVYGLALPLAACARLLPEHHEQRRAAPPLPHLREAVGVMRSSRSLPDFAGALSMAVFIVLILTGPAFTVTPLFLAGEFGASATTRGAIQALVQLGSVVTSLSGARVALLWGNRVRFSAGVALVTLGLAVVGTAPALPMVAVGLFGLGGGLGLIFPLLDEVAVSSVPGRYRGSAVGAVTAAGRLGATMGPVLAGGVAAAAGDRWVFVGAAAASALVLVGWRPVQHAAGRGRAGPSGIPHQVP